LRQILDPVYFLITDCGLAFRVVDHKGFKNMLIGHLSGK
jgi:hypothetical protein